MNYRNLYNSDNHIDRDREIKINQRDTETILNNPQKNRI